MFCVHVCEGVKERGWQEVRCSNSSVTIVLHVKTSFGLGLCTQGHGPHLEEGFQSFKQYQVCGEVDKMCMKQLSS